MNHLLSEISRILILIILKRCCLSPIQREDHSYYTKKSKDANNKLVFVINYQTRLTFGTRIRYFMYGKKDQTMRILTVYCRKIRHFIPMHVLESDTSYQCMVCKCKPWHISHIFCSTVHIFWCLKFLIKLWHK